MTPSDHTRRLAPQPPPAMRVPNRCCRPSIAMIATFEAEGDSRELFKESACAVELMGHGFSGVTLDAAHRSLHVSSLKLPVDLNGPPDFTIAGNSRCGLSEVVERGRLDTEFRRQLDMPDTISVAMRYQSGHRQVVVERDTNVWTLDEARRREQERALVVIDQLRRWNGLKTLRRMTEAQRVDNCFRFAV